METIHLCEDYRVGAGVVEMMGGGACVALVLVSQFHIGTQVALFGGTAQNPTNLFHKKCRAK
jgi:hypothetical protein